MIKLLPDSSRLLGAALSLLSLADLTSAHAGHGAHAAFPRAADTSASAFAFNLSQVTLGEGRFFDNQQRTLNYLLGVDVDRLLYNFWSNHGLATDGIQSNGGWDAPDFPFRTHSQGHFLTGWAHCYAQLGDDECRSRAVYFVEELAKCQANNEAVGFNEGYLSGFPESDITAVEDRTLDNGNVPYYAIHKTMAGLLDVWRLVGDETARDVLLSFSGWVDWRTGQLSYDKMQAMLQTEFGGMNDIMAEVYHQTGDEKWLAVAQRFDHAVVFDPLAGGQDALNGLHANTQVPKWIGAVQEFLATGTERYRDIASNAWALTVNDHTYAIGGNSQAEHFREPDAIAAYLDEDTSEACNTYNMLKLTRALWALTPGDATYFDFYERALLNHLLGQQDPSDSHGHITYFTPLNPGGRRGVGPAWGGGTWSTDYDSFWCCQGTALETNTKLMDSIYFHDADGSTLYVNLFIPSKLDWSEKETTVTQSTSFPVGESATLVVDGAGEWTMAIRIPSWTDEASITVNGEAVDVDTTANSYAMLQRTWSAGDEVVVTFPMRLRTVAANDDDSLAAVAYGPTILSGKYGDATLSGSPTIDLSTIQRTADDVLEFEATADGAAVTLGPFYDAQGFNYNVYWKLSGELP
jgi:DUF1680 family protein